MRKKISPGQAILAWINILVGSGTALLGLWAFLQTLLDWNFQMSLYYIFAMGFGAFFCYIGLRKWRSRVP